jgi:hypothetical protein
VALAGGEDLGEEGLGVGVFALIGEHDGDVERGGDGIEVIGTLMLATEGEDADGVTMRGGVVAEGAVDIGDDFADVGFDQRGVGEAAVELGGGAVEDGVEFDVAVGLLAGGGLLEEIAAEKIGQGFAGARFGFGELFRRGWRGRRGTC